MFSLNIVKISQSKHNWFIVSVEITNKMQPCNIIYYSTVHWRLNMFRAAYRSSSGPLTVFAASGLHTHVVTGRSQVWVGTNLLSKWRHVSTQGVIIRPIIEPYLRYIKWKCTFLGGQNAYANNRRRVPTRLIFYNTINIKIYPFFLLWRCDSTLVMASSFWGF